MSERTEPVLELTLTSQDINNLLPELEAYSAIYRPLFRRREQRDQAKKYLHGLLLDDVSNKSIESIIQALEGDDPNAIRAMQQFVGKGVWPDEVILQQHWQEVNQDLGDENGVIILAERGFVKHGQDSVGVKRQWCSELSKMVNCQIGLFLAYASSKGYTLLDRRLYLPEEWVNDDTYAKRRQKCGIPGEIEYKTKTELAQDMIQAVSATDSLRHRWFVCAQEFGRNSAFLDHVAELVYYFAEVPQDTLVWLEHPMLGVPKWMGRGHTSVRDYSLVDEPTGRPIKAIAGALSPAQWSRHTVEEGGNGSKVADFATLPVVTVRDGLLGPKVWLVLRRSLNGGEFDCYLSNAPTKTRLATFAWLSDMHWHTGHCFKDGTQLVGLGDYQVRSWTGWHHHMTLCILAHFFLVRCKLRRAAGLLFSAARALFLPTQGVPQ
jgi:SRSO17 transposase